MSRIIRFAEAAKIFGVSNSTLYRLQKAHDFPPLIKVTPNGRASGFFEDQIEEYLAKIKIDKNKTTNTSQTDPLCGESK
ncbi:helix-turn-helix transcriptional regulator [Deefgea rivuli]|uniref:helix-turn-helix transcriptional regulator n=1 Tax=Deefgea rivuli TaxID=400948 RepID=UPI00146FC468|nr:AlpA family phage regulatory protein [Deefgea rivuli]